MIRELIPSGDERGILAGISPTQFRTSICACWAIHCSIAYTGVVIRQPEMSGEKHLIEIRSRDPIDGSGA